MFRYSTLAVVCLFIGLDCLLVSGCGSVRLVAPEGRELVLLEEEDETSVHTERRIWFWLWGSKKISDDTPAPEIEEYDLKEIRIDSKQTVLDTLINIVAGLVSIVCRTMVVEGNA